jgi:hypothetical protein
LTGAIISSMLPYCNERPASLGIHDEV